MSQTTVRTVKHTTVRAALLSLCCHLKIIYLLSEKDRILLISGCYLSRPFYSSLFIPIQIYISLFKTNTYTHKQTHTKTHTHIALSTVLKGDPIKRKLMEAMTIRESTSYAMARVHHALKKVAVYLVSLCHVDPVAQRLSSSR